MLSTSVLLLALFAQVMLGQQTETQPGIQLLSDPLVAGPQLEIVHLFNGEWPTGVTVSNSGGRLFTNYPPGLDVNNTNNGHNGKFTVGELTSFTAGKPFPTVEYNSPPGGAINYTTTAPSGANYRDYFIGVQSVVVDSANRLWVLDTGRAFDPRNSTTLVPASLGGAKLVGIDLDNNDQVFTTIVFPQTVAYPDSYLNDVRIDLRPSVSSSGKGIAYITDSSLEGRNGIIIVDLGTGESWRHLDNTIYVRPETGFVASVWGQPLYTLDPTRKLTTIGFGSDGIALSSDGEELFWGAVGSRTLWSVSTSLLRRRDQASELVVQGAVRNRGQKGLSDGFETDSNGIIYLGNMELNAINAFDPLTNTVSTFVRDPRLSWVDTMSVGTDGYLYFTDNQLWLSDAFYPGTDRRQRPFSVLRAKLPNGGKKVML